MTEPANFILSSKFFPYTLGHEQCLAPGVKEEIDAIPATSLTQVKPHIYDAGRWFLKMVRSDLATTLDTHLYRVRKAEKVRRYLEKNNLSDHLVVPKKYIYLSPAPGAQPLVVCEKLNLSEEVASVESPEFRAGWTQLPEVYQTGGQCRALYEGKPTRDLSVVQAKALAELSTLGYTDLSYNNLYFTRDGRVAIIDTEPVKISLKKRLLTDIPLLLRIEQRLLGTRQSLTAQQAIAGLSKLKLWCRLPESRAAVERVERICALKSLARSAGRVVVIGMVAFYAIPTVMGLGTALIVKVVLVFVVTRRLFTAGHLVSLHMRSVYNLWDLSCMPMGFGAKQIEALEKQEAL